MSIKIPYYKKYDILMIRVGRDSTIQVLGGLTDLLRWKNVNTLFYLISVGCHLELHVARTFTGIIVFYQLSYFMFFICILIIKNDTLGNML